MGKLGRGNTYYVDSQYGSDDHHGKSPQKAWKSIERANRQMFMPGDTLLFKKGQVFGGLLKPQMKRTGDARFVIASYGDGEKPTIDGQGSLPAAVWMYNLQNFEIIDLRIVNQAPQRRAKMAGLKVEIDNYGIAKNIALRNLDVENVNGLLEKQKGGGCGILIENGGKETISIFNGLLIEGCTIRRCERNAIRFGAYWSRQEWNPNLNVVIRKNLIEEVPGDGIVPIGCDGALIEHNVMRNCTRLLPLGEAAAGIWPWSCDNTVIQFNEVSDHKAPWDGQGFDSDWNCRHTIIQYNYSHDNEGGFVLVCNDGGVGSDYSVGNTGTIVRYNVSLNDGIRRHRTHAGVFSPVVHFAGPAKQTQFYNNLIIHAGQLADTLDNRFIHFSGWGGMPGDTRFANNVFVSHTPTEIDLAGCQGIEFANNLFSGVFGHMPTQNGNIYSLPNGKEWQLLTPSPKGFEGLGMFKSRSDFEGLGKGIKVDGLPPSDFFGNSISGKVWNIGIDQTEFSTINH
ncbi:MAG: right-handed parallel beta-helix repeat-containing protein [Breznakibacter sp.]